RNGETQHHRRTHVRRLVGLEGNARQRVGLCVSERSADAEHECTQQRAQRTRRVYRDDHDGLPCGRRSSKFEAALCATEAGARGLPPSADHAFLVRALRSHCLRSRSATYVILPATRWPKVTRCSDGFTSVGSEARIASPRARKSTSKSGVVST